jgi:sulfur relay (sulfurtransferase) DsrC/TusE family protein
MAEDAQGDMDCRESWEETVMQALSLQGEMHSSVELWSIICVLVNFIYEFVCCGYFTDFCLL